MDLKLTEHVRNTISILYKQKKKKKTGEIPIFGTFLAKKWILAACILLKIDISRWAMIYYITDRFLWF